MSVTEYLADMTAAVDAELVAGLDPGNSTLEKAMHYALSVKAKRLRPLLYLSLLDGCGIPWREHLVEAAAIEMIHTYSLIHDDLPCMDNDDFRRGQPTVHKVFGEAVALLAGDTLLTYAFERIAAARIKPQAAVEMMRIITAGIGKDGMAGGQVLDLEFSGEAGHIPRIHTLKTAELIKSTLCSAAVVAELPPSHRRGLAEVGLTIGCGFQLADDLLDVTGDEQVVGKKLHKDDHNQSPNAVLFYGIETVKQEIDRAYRMTMSLLHEMNISFPPFLTLIEMMVYRSK